jgi:hypothetical protein
MESSPGCWAAYGEVLNREYSDMTFAGNHRLTVDAYAVQHPGRASRQSIQSVCIHLVSLCLVLEHGRPQPEVTRLMSQGAGKKSAFEWLEPPASTGGITVKDVLEKTSAADHRDAVMSWARSAWDAWAAHHERIRVWAARVAEG